MRPLHSCDWMIQHQSAGYSAIARPDMAYVSNLIQHLAIHSPEESWKQWIGSPELHPSVTLDTFPRGYKSNETLRSHPPNGISRCLSCTLPHSIRNPCHPPNFSSLQEACLGSEMIIIRFSALLASPRSVRGKSFLSNHSARLPCWHC